MNKTIIIGVIGFFLVLSMFSAYAGSEYEILLKSKHFTPAPGMNEDARSYIQSLSPQRAHVLIQLYYIPTPEQRKGLEAKGIKLLSYGPNKAWFASIPSHKVSEIAEYINTGTRNYQTNLTINATKEPLYAEKQLNLTRNYLDKEFWLTLV